MRIWVLKAARFHFTHFFMADLGNVFFFFSSLHDVDQTKTFWLICQQTGQSRPQRRAAFMSEVGAIGPLHRLEGRGGDEIDAASCAFVTDAGTDPGRRGANFLTAGPRWALIIGQGGAEPQQMAGVCR